MLSKIYNLLNYCFEDSIIDKFAGIEFQLFLLSTKSLIPYENKIGCMFDINRYKWELDVFAYYKNGDDSTLDYYLENKTSSINYDKLMEYKIISVVISNTDWNTLIEEVLKIVMFYTLNKNTILNAILLSSVIYEYFDLDIIDLDYIKNKTNDRMIEFSLKEFSEKNSMTQIDKKYIIGFEKERVNMILKGNCISEDELMKFKALQHIVNSNKAVKLINSENEVLLKNFSSYVLKLRKGTVNPDKLKYSFDLPLDFKEYLKKSSFVHPLLGKCIVMERNSSEIILKNKLGFLKVNI